MSEAPFHKEMQCFVETVAYDFDQLRGTVWISSSGCTDMGGCIAFFERIDPSVRLIETYSDDKRDTSYRKNAGGQWESCAP